jgi:hypothetical protein
MLAAILPKWNFSEHSDTELQLLQGRKKATTKVKLKFKDHLQINKMSVL